MVLKYTRVIHRRGHRTRLFAPEAFLKIKKVRNKHRVYYHYPVCIIGGQAISLANRITRLLKGEVAGLVCLF